MNTNKGGIVKQSGNDVEDYRSQKVLFQPSVRVFLQYNVKRYLNEKNLIHDRVMATISKFSSQIFETYFRAIQHRCIHLRVERKTLFQLFQSEPEMENCHIEWTKT